MLNSFFSTIGATLKTFQIKDAVDIIVVSLIIYYLFLLIRQTRSAQLVKGLAILVVAYLISAIFNLTMMNYLLKTIFEFAVIIIVIIFQPEIRKILENIGKQKFAKSTFRSFMSKGIESLTDLERKAISDVSDVSTIFAKNKIGALIVFERETLLTEIAESGTELDCETSVTMFSNIFYKGAPLHDGACIIRNGKIYAAGCILPLSKRNDLSSIYGTRHRAALGISEESDAVVVIVSEETGRISLALRGSVEVDLTRKELYERLVELVINEEKTSSFISSFSKKEKEGEE